MPHQSISPSLLHTAPKMAGKEVSVGDSQRKKQRLRVVRKHAHGAPRGKRMDSPWRVAFGPVLLSRPQAWQHSAGSSSGKRLQACGSMRQLRSVQTSGSLSVCPPAGALVPPHGRPMPLVHSKTGGKTTALALHPAPSLCQGSVAWPRTRAHMTLPE